MKRRDTHLLNHVEVLNEVAEILAVLVAGIRFVELLDESTEEGAILIVAAQRSRAGDGSNDSKQDEELGRH